MHVHLLFLGVGIACLVGGGSALVKGAATLAHRLGVAPVLVGLTVVAFGTSTPELVVNVAAALRGRTDIGFGNVIGSNIANIGLLLAVTAVIAPLAVHRTLTTREIPMMILAAAAALVLGGGGLLGEAEAGYARGDGLMLLLLFAVFLYYTIGEALDPERHTNAATEPPPPDTRAGSSVGRWTGISIIGGLAALMLGGELTVRGAVGIAEEVGLSEAVIGLTIVAVGTSLPELSTTLTAARRGEGDLAIGNIIGSNIYNVLFIWGLSVTIAPSALPAGGVGDLLVMTGLSLILLPMVISGNRLGRLEGGAMLLVYAGYVAWLAAR